MLKRHAEIERFNSDTSHFSIYNINNLLYQQLNIYRDRANETYISYLFKITSERNYYGVFPVFVGKVKYVDGDAITMQHNNHYVSTYEELLKLFDTYMPPHPDSAL